MAIFLSMYVFSILGFIIHVFKLPAQDRTKAKLIELFLLYQIVFSIGLTSLIAFIGLTFMGPYVASYSGWTPCAFQQLLANVNLAFFVLGMLSIYYRGLFWTATIIGFSVWILGDGIYHIYDYLFHHNDAEGNVGVMLYTDLIVPILLLFLLFLYSETNVAEH